MFSLYFCICLDKKGGREGGRGGREGGSDYLSYSIRINRNNQMIEFCLVLFLVGIRGERGREGGWEGGWERIGLSDSRV